MAGEVSELTKPKYTESCNGCGLCCAAELCDVAEYFFEGSPAPCPALEFEDGRTWCGLVRHPSRHLAMHFNADTVITPMILKLIPIGQGCGMEDD